METLNSSAVISNETGILSKRGGRFHTPSTFAAENLYYILWGDEYRCSNIYRVKREFLDSLSFYHIISGKMEFCYRDQKYTAVEGETVLLDLRFPHEYRALTDLTVQQYLVSGNRAQQYYHYITEQYGFRFSPNGKIALLFGKLQQEAETESMNEHRVSYLLHEIFSRLLIQETPKISPAITKAQQYILRHYQESISVDEIADHVLLSKSHLNRLFRKELNCGPHEYLLQTRLNFSKELLTETSLSVESIAYRTGFQSATHFIRAFKQASRMTPSYFRRYFNPLLGFGSGTENPEEFPVR